MKTTEPKKHRVPKKYFSLNPFWSSPEILEFTMEQFVLIATKNACSYVTVFGLADLFGIENVETVIHRHEYDKRCRSYLINAIDLYKRQEEILNGENDIELETKEVPMKKETEKALEMIKDFGFFKEKRAVLMGGTALSIHLRHRLSKDLDFMFYRERILPREDLLLFQDRFKAEFLPFDQLTQREFINEGGDVNDYRQRFAIDGVKIEFVTNLGNILERTIVNENSIEDYNGIGIISLDALMQMKSLLIMDRSKTRDLYDIVWAIKNGLLEAERFIEIVKQYRLTYEENYIINRIKHLRPSSDDEELENLVPNPPSFEELKAYLLGEVEKTAVCKAKKRKQTWANRI